jgi:8-oxo-dGTP pyrophosphatase MutT (NUDIX family)
LGDETFITATGPLTAANAVAAILVLDDGRYVMQLRDPLPGIFYPGHWGCFGGAVDRGENPKQTLIRELREELEFEVTMANEFTRFDFDLRKVGQERVYRIYFEVPVSTAAFAQFVLHEGARFCAFSAADILLQPRVTPYDAFAIWLHCNRERFGS